VARKDIARDVVLSMSDMKATTAWIWEHYQCVELWLRG
jgi:hypothetical protein